MNAIRSKLTYANLAATLAVVLALGTTTAYAAGLAKNSVKSSHIKNGQVKSVDIKNDALTGADVKEASLARVPDAAKLGGFSATSYLRPTSNLAGAIADGQLLQLTVLGYGSAGVRCDNNGTPATANDDLVNLFRSGLGTGTVAGVRLFSSGSPTDDANIRIADQIMNTSSESTVQTDRMQADLYYRSADGTKAIRYWVWAWDDTTTTGCYGVIEAQILR